MLEFFILYLVYWCYVASGVVASGEGSHSECISFVSGSFDWVDGTLICAVCTFRYALCASSGELLWNDWLIFLSCRLQAGRNRQSASCYCRFYRPLLHSKLNTLMKTIEMIQKAWSSSSWLQIRNVSSTYLSQQTFFSARFERQSPRTFSYKNLQLPGSEDCPLRLHPCVQRRHYFIENGFYFE